MKITNRCKGVSPSVTLAISAKAKLLKSQGLDVISFGAGEPDFNTPKFICDAAKEALDLGITKYTPASGTMELKKAIVNTLAKKGLEYKPENIVVSNGAKHSLHNAIASIVEEGDEVLLPIPYWVSYSEMIKISGGTPVYVPCDENFVINLDEMEKLITDKTTALILNNPSNPTGVVLSKDIIKRIAEICVKNDINVISDEIYDQLIYIDDEIPSIATMDGMKERTIVINGVSKTYSMTGWRIGYLAAPENVAKAIASMQSHTTSGPNSIAQYASCAALNGSLDEAIMMKKAFIERRDAAVAAIEKIDGLTCIVPDGAFYIMIKVSNFYGKSINGKKINNSLDFSSLLLEESLVALVPGDDFGTPEYVRISYACSMENILEGIKRIAEFTAKCN
ncbi:MAG: pyridoxal phosphate-dependent aminotransferase [Clostridia bacterium]|nr:pyridoxal phosphate-dependent aminotransferase [Clostridia bacterium]